MVKYILPIIAGALLTFAFAPFAAYSLAFFCPAVLLYFWIRSTPKQAFFEGLLFGLGFFGVATSWVYVSIHTYGNTPIPVALIVTGLFVLVMAAYPAMQGYLLTRFFHRKKEWVVCLLVFPSSWVFFEMLRATLFTGFPYVFLGYSQLSTPLHAFVPIAGVYGASLACAFIAGSLVLLAHSHKTNAKYAAVAVITIICLLGFYFSKRTWTHPAGDPIKISLIQGNIPIDMKWNDNELHNTLKKYETMTNQHWDNSLIVWPEAAIPTLPNMVESYVRRLSDKAKAHKSTLVFGAPLLIGKNYYNGLVMVGSNTGFYLKRHLVPFGEFYPLQPLFRWFTDYFNIPMSNFTKGAWDQLPLSFGNLKYATLICYEIAYSYETLYSTRGKQFIVTISDDSWFGESFAMAQQFQMSQFRALETGRPVLAATNSGITGIIDSSGNVIKQAPINVSTTITASISPMDGKTPLMHFAYWPLISFMVLLFLCAIFL